MTAAVIVTIIVAAVSIVGSLLAVAFKVGGLASQITVQGEALEQHRAESTKALGDLRDDVSELRKDAGDIRERMVALETTYKLRAVR